MNGPCHAGKQYPGYTKRIEQNLRSYSCVHFAYSGLTENGRLAEDVSRIIIDASFNCSLLVLHAVQQQLNLLIHRTN
ncbi:hypothetical protein D3C71_1859610 [compost metagenome]